MPSLSDDVHDPLSCFLSNLILPGLVTGKPSKASLQGRNFCPKGHVLCLSWVLRDCIKSLLQDAISVANACTQIFRATLFVNSQSCKNPSLLQWENPLWCICGSRKERLLTPSGADRPQRRDDEWQQLASKGYIYPVWSYSMGMKWQTTVLENSCQGRKRRSWSKANMRVIWREMGMFYTLTVKGMHS